MKQMPIILLTVILLLGLAACGKDAAPADTLPTQVETTEQPSAETTAPLPTEIPTEPAPTPAPEPAEDAFVRVQDHLPTARQALAYATDDNFTRTKIYSFHDAYLRYGTVKKLELVARELEGMGYYLLIWDAFRPVSAQKILWDVYPDPSFVANPLTGFSSHSRGNTVDLTLTDADGVPVEMPSAFDDFSSRANREYSDCTETAAHNATLLETVMEKYGFTGYSEEWWHFTDTEEYPVAEDFQPMKPRWYCVSEENTAELLADPDGEIVTRIPGGEEFMALARLGEYLFVDYQGQMGYLPEENSQEILLEGAGFPTEWAANCDEYISLRTRPSVSAPRICTIPVGSTFELLDWEWRFAKIRYEGKEGYVLSSYTWPETPQWSAQILKRVPLTEVYSYEQMLEDIDEMVAAYPELVEKDSIGTSELGREIPVLRIGSPEAKHHVLLHGAIHGREYVTSWILMAVTDYWLERDMDALAEDICFHIIPMCNPDGVVIAQTGTLPQEARKIYFSDCDRGHGESSYAEYTSLWKANALGVDLNRNFPAQWDSEQLKRTEPSCELYPGDEPFCAAETQALRDYTLAWDFAATISYHSSGSIIFHEFGREEPVNARSRSLAQAVEAVSGYSLASSVGVNGGGYKDWAMEELGIPSVTVEIGCSGALLDGREIYSTFSRNCGIFPTIKNWLQ